MIRVEIHVKVRIVRNIAPIWSKLVDAKKAQYLSIKETVSRGSPYINILQQTPKFCFNNTGPYSKSR